MLCVKNHLGDLTMMHEVAQAIDLELTTIRTKGDFLKNSLLDGSDTDDLSEHR